MDFMVQHHAVQMYGKHRKGYRGHWKKATKATQTLAHVTDCMGLKRDLPGITNPASMKLGCLLASFGASYRHNTKFLAVSGIK
eukprot:scaffold8899_cov17-Tisochrysis_lutea.AAC.1